MVQEIMTAGIMGGLSKTTSMRKKIVSDTLDAVLNQLEKPDKLEHEKALAKALRCSLIADPDVIKILDSLFKKKDVPAAFHFRDGKIYRPNIQNDLSKKKIVIALESQVMDGFTGRIEVNNWHSGEITVEVFPKSSRNSIEKR